MKKMIKSNGNQVIPQSNFNGSKKEAARDIKEDEYRQKMVDIEEKRVINEANRIANEAEQLNSVAELMKNFVHK